MKSIVKVSLLAAMMAAPLMADESFGGIGVTIYQIREGVKVAEVIPGTPAAETKLQAGDVITAVDGVSLQGLNIEQSKEKLRGQVNKPLEITFTSEGESYTAVLRRAQITVKDLEGAAVKNWYGDKAELNAQELETFASASQNDKQLVVNPEYRLGRITWGDDKLALYEESSSKQKFRRTVCFVPCDTNAVRKVLFTQTTEVDTLGDFPVYGRPYTARNQYGRNVLWTDAKHSYIYLTGNDRPNAEGFRQAFLDRLTLKDAKMTQVWKSSDDCKETLSFITDYNPKQIKFVGQRQAFGVVPDYWAFDLRNKKKERQITHIVNPVPQFAQEVTDQYVTYTRKDGLKCFAHLYLPAGYDKERDGRLPVFMWTYPYEFRCFAEAEKARPEKHKFTKPGYGSAMIWATQGYAVLDEFTMAIVAADKDSLPNDQFLSQLVMSAEAAVDFVCDSLGIGDRDRIGVGGHSYGGFMTANLLAHTKLFRAGIARSGAYNRSLTPFGFQSERRNYWKAKDVYDQMSPFNYADKIKDALMLIHGQMDNNTGTFPVQSERLYQALVYFGGTARYVQLPYESHGYQGIETTLDMLYETGAWLDKYVKEAKPRKKAEKKAEKADN